MMTLFFKKKWLNNFQEMKTPLAVGDVKTEQNDEDDLIIYIDDEDRSNTDATKCTDHAETTPASSSISQVDTSSKSTSATSSLSTGPSTVAPESTSIPTETLSIHTSKTNPIMTNTEALSLDGMVGNSPQETAASAPDAADSASLALASASNLTGSAPPVADNQSLQHAVQPAKVCPVGKNKHARPANINAEHNRKRKREKLSNADQSTSDAHLSPSAASNGNDNSKQYYAPAHCSVCQIGMFSALESRYHTVYHQTKQCCVCRTTLVEVKVKRHMYTCLLQSGKLTNDEMLAYMAPCWVRVSNKQKVRRRKKATNNETNALTPLKNQIQSSRKRSTIYDQNMPKIKKKKLFILFGNENSIQDSSASSSKEKRSEISTVAQRDKKSIRRRSSNGSSSNAKSSSARKKSNDMTDTVYDNTSIPICWDQDCAKDRFFSAQNWAVTRNHYLHDLSDVTTPSDTDQTTTAAICQIIEAKRKQRHTAPVSNQSNGEAKQTAATSTVIGVQADSSQEMSDDEQPMVIAEDERAQTPNDTSTAVNGQLDGGETLPNDFSLATIPANEYSYSISYNDTVYNEKSGLPLGITVQAQAPKHVAPKQVQKQRSSNPNPFHIIPEITSRTPPTDVPLVPVSTAPAPPPSITTHKIPISPAQKNPSRFHTSSPSTLPADTAKEPVSSTSQPPPTKTVKILSPNELNMRAEHMAKANTQANKPHSIGNNYPLRESPLRQALARNEHATPPMYPYQNGYALDNYSNELAAMARMQMYHRNANYGYNRDIHPTSTSSPVNTHISRCPSSVQISLIRDKEGYIDLIFKSKGSRILYDQMTDHQRMEVRNDLLGEGVWQKMLNHIIKEQPTTQALLLFKKLLPPNETKIFFSTYNSHRMKKLN